MGNITDELIGDFDIGGIVNIVEFFIGGIVGTAIESFPGIPKLFEDVLTSSISVLIIIIILLCKKLLT
jgi:uncharacterized membrane protein YqgA involved in biofilm formation